MGVWPGVEGRSPVVGRECRIGGDSALPLALTHLFSFKINYNITVRSVFKALCLSL